MEKKHEGLSGIGRLAAGRIPRTGGMARRRDPVMTGMIVATAVLVVLFATGYFAVWLEVELPWTTDVGATILFWAILIVMFVGWPLAVWHARKLRRREDTAAIDRAREALAARGVRVERSAGAERGDRMSLDLPNVREYRHMPWTNANVKSEDRP